MIEVRGVGQRAGGRRTLRDVSLTIGTGELVAIIGGSGAGKTTLLDAIAGVRPPAEGEVGHDGDAGTLGYVPQDDIVHLEMPLRRTLRYAAGLRLPSGTPPEELDEAVDAALAALALTDRAGQRVGSLSGGERKRASIAVELLTGPRVFFLDEPTSGLDPASAAGLMRLLRGLADTGTTVVLTTHHPPDVAVCDRVAVLALDGTLAFHGTPDEALDHFQAKAFEDVYLRLADVRPSRVDRGRPDGDASSRTSAAVRRDGGRPIGAWRQWALLTRRNADLLTRSRLTLAVLVGSPVMVLAMFAVLFRPDAFSPGSPSPGATVMILFWIAFGGFFFGLTYGLSQICTELPVLRRERLTGLRIGPYVLAKVAVLLPLLAVVDALMLGVLRALDRLPALGWGAYGEVFVTLVACSLAALALGLLVSAAVTDPTQATMALPMLCFPQVLFVGAILPVPVMAAPGRWLSHAMSNRWAFEGLGHSLGVERLWGSGRSPLGPPLLASYGDTFARAVAVDWAVLGGFTVLFLAGTCLVLARRT
ncbi:ABC-type multidrug transport system ATPase subunit [Actinomadura pelletieri DSM 43383]|uniref:ABC-type multidrug transport system ATPase subunit n=1 Tax=Actinomadura pelletieri DSM 43383 TaxID=1120940 RepID=A0A495QM79_9ACTN|nr:ATP-binding cassette domain-containing protein [Actinomadura pelletieri]RKS73636.1 ABC-type multidrug transport system ATPase subunit [Actinomadura pelletieri DSM 43383]